MAKLDRLAARFMMVNEAAGGGTIRHGGCLCGAIRYRVEGEPSAACHCHCTMCRPASGAPLVAWATFPSAGFALTRGKPARHASSARATRQFCANCGTQLIFQYNDRADQEIDVTVASLDAADRPSMREHGWTSSRLPWAQVDEHLPTRPEPAA